MLDCFVANTPENAVPITALVESELAGWLERQSGPVRQWIDASGFKARPGSHCLVPDGEGNISRVLLGVKASDDYWAFGGLAAKLPAGIYRLDDEVDGEQRERAAVGWGLGAYRFTRYKGANDQDRPQLCLEEGSEAVEQRVRAVYLVRDLVNTPAGDLTPEAIGEAARELAEEFDAEFNEVAGESLLENNYPLIHGVGRAAAAEPRLIELNWGRENDPRLTLVGKGISFDTGGLNIKPGSNMRLMKKDMGGAAHVLGLARLVMATGLPVRLQVLIPAAENAISGSSFRPGDVLSSRKGSTVEIDNTDAEGRLVLADAITRAMEAEPDLLVDFATLTGAARVALGTEVPAFFSNRSETAGELMAAGEAEQEPVWQLPLHQGYAHELESDIADLVNSGPAPFGGAITAALFLQHFVGEGPDWVHFDVMAWNNRERPGRPKGGEAMGLLATWAYLSDRFGGE